MGSIKEGNGLHIIESYNATVGHYLARFIADSLLFEIDRNSEIASLAAIQLETCVIYSLVSNREFGA